MPLSRVPAAGGPPQPLTQFAAGESTHRWPQVLPGENAVIFTASVQGTLMREADIQTISLKTRQTKTLVRGGYFGRYLPSGHLVYLREGRLYGLAFDPVRLEVQGEGVPLLETCGGKPSHWRRPVRFFKAGHIRVYGGDERRAKVAGSMAG